jgi:hypothetical protein
VQHGIAGDSTEGLVDVFQLMNVHDQHSQVRTIGPGSPDRLFQASQQQAQIGQAG